MAMTTPVQFRSGPDSPAAKSKASGSNSRRTLGARLNAAWQALTEEAAEVEPFKPNPTGIFAWAMAEIASASVWRMSDDDDGPRVAMIINPLGNPIWQPTRKSQDDLAARVRKAWPELDAEQVRKCLAHISARVRVELMKPSQGATQEEQREALRGNWVHGWRA